MKKDTKKLLTLGVTAGFLAAGCMTAFAAYKDAVGYTVTDGWAIEDGKFLYIENGTALTNTWKQDSTVWVYLGEDGKAVTNCWRWIDGNQDGVSECYYFDKDGLMASDTDIEGYTVNADGAWTVDGVVQIKSVAETADKTSAEPTTRIVTGGYWQIAGPGMGTALYYSDEYGVLKDGWYWVTSYTNPSEYECYYFDEEGFVLDRPTNIDGFEVSWSGSWAVDGVVQTKQ